MIFKSTSKKFETTLQDYDLEKLNDLYMDTANRINKLNGLKTHHTTLSNHHFYKWKEAGASYNQDYYHEPAVSEGVSTLSTIAAGVGTVGYMMHKFISEVPNAASTADYAFLATGGLICTAFAGAIAGVSAGSLMKGIVHPIEWVVNAVKSYNNEKKLDIIDQQFSKFGTVNPIEKKKADQNRMMSHSQTRKSEIFSNMLADDSFAQNENRNDSRFLEKNTRLNSFRY